MSRLIKMIKKILKVLSVLIFVIPILLIAGLYMICPIINDRVARMTARDIIELPLPEDTELVESKSEAGKLAGNGNGMQYFGAILIKSGSSLDELSEYYGAYADNEWTYCVANQESSVIQQIEHPTVSFDTEINENGYYIVYSWGSYSGIASEFDLRGH